MGVNSASPSTEIDEGDSQKESVSSRSSSRKAPVQDADSLQQAPEEVAVSDSPPTVTFRNVANRRKRFGTARHLRSRTRQQAEASRLAADA
jgi:hypothetical protein